MDRELKPPYVPPKEKVIQDKDIAKLESEGKMVVNEVQVGFDSIIVCQAEQGQVKYNKEKAKDPNWDKEF